MADSKPIVLVKYDDPQVIQDAMRLLVGAIKAVLIEKHYDYASHTFVDSSEENLNRAGFFVTGPKTLMDTLSKPSTEKLSVWYRVLVPIKQKSILVTIQRFMGDLKKDVEVNGKSYPASNFKFPAFFMCAIWIVLFHLNTISSKNQFRQAYLRHAGLESQSNVRMVYRFKGQFEVPGAKFKPPFDIITSEAARDLHDTEGYTKVKKEVDQDPEIVEAVKDMDPNAKALFLKKKINKILTERNISVYLDLKNKSKKDGELFPLNNFYFIFTDNPSENDYFRDLALKYLKSVYDPFKSDDQVNLQFDRDNSSLIPTVGIAPPKSDEKPAPTPSAPKSSQKSTPKVDVELPPTSMPTKNKRLSEEEQEEERLKKIWAAEIVSRVIEKLGIMISNAKTKAKILGSLYVAAGLSANKTKTGGDVFNLNTARLVKKDNQCTGIVIGSVPGEPLFKGVRVDLAMNVKDDTVMKWFSSSKIGTPTNMTANNKALSTWVREDLMPQIWARFIDAISDDVRAMNASNFEEEGDLDERVDKVGAETQEGEEEISKPTFKSTFNLEKELGFMPSFAASIPILPESVDTRSLGGDLSKLRSQVFNVDKAAMGLDKTQVEQLKIVKKNMASIFTPETQPVIAALRARLTADGRENVGPNGTPFVMEEPDVGRIDQFNADYRLRSTVTTEEPEFEDEDGEEQDA